MSFNHWPLPITIPSISEYEPQIYKLYTTTTEHVHTSEPDSLSLCFLCFFSFFFLFFTFSSSVSGPSLLSFDVGWLRCGHIIQAGTIMIEAERYSIKSDIKTQVKRNKIALP